MIAGYFLYGWVVERVFAPDDRKTPAFTKQDGVDFIPMPTWKAFLVQLLNIAGTGPIFGALMGACFGPVVFLWIIFGSVLGGGVHDFMSGTISKRHDGASIAELSGIYLGSAAKWIMRVFSVVLLLLTGTVFVNSPAALLARLTPDALNVTFWIVVILIYYVLATLLPIDKIIGRLYPVFGAALTQLDFNVLWRYFSWSNQTLAMISLWVATAYLLKTKENKSASLITALPAAFMTAVSVTYILMANEGFRLGADIGYPIGIAAAVILFGVYVFIMLKKKKDPA